ncbi:MAG: aminopeptidase P family N-terminal domain-containing protein, partial [Roseibium sp.]|nr:aminopeptidase P family N-terminal domain-containing protein [Roseibium sp.]
MSDDMIRIYEMNNGEKAFSPFSANEMDSRQSKLRQLMSDRQIDACLFTSYHNICYYSGFLYCYF